MKSPQALALCISGLTQLAVPHVGQQPWDGVFYGERTVKRALPKMAEALAGAMARNGISRPEELTSFILSHPRFLDITGMDNDRLMRISPVLFEIVLQSMAAGLGDLPIPGMAIAGLRHIVGEGNGGEAEMTRSLSMTRVCAREHCCMFRQDDPELERKRRDFLRLIAAGEDHEKARLLLPKGGAHPLLPRKYGGSKPVK
jgi:hypothetical protein